MRYRPETAHRTHLTYRPERLERGEPGYFTMGMGDQLTVNGSTLICGDVRDVLATLPAGSVRCVGTSPPYMGLRSYAVDPSVWGGDPEHTHVWGPERVKRDTRGLSGSTLEFPNTKGALVRFDQHQGAFCLCGSWIGRLGNEPTLDAYVAHLVEVFRAVRRVLSADGTCWIVIGDSFSNDGKWGGSTGGKHANGLHGSTGIGRERKFTGLKAKDLCLVPARVALALQAPYYTGRIRSEADRAWLAAAIDGEGCIFIGRKPAGTLTGRVRADGSRYAYAFDQFQSAIRVTNTNEAFVRRVAEITRVGVTRTFGRGHRPIFEWSCYSRETRTLLSEIYPHLVAKQHEARLAIGCKATGGDAAWEGLKLLHHGRATTVDFPPPPSLFEPGWYIRSECIWEKPNVLPSSVTDRPTMAHEHVFMLAKSPRYYFDAFAVRELSAQPTRGPRADRFGGNKHGAATTMHSDGSTWNGDLSTGRNMRSVLSISTAPYVGAHFAVFPSALIEPMVKAGSSDARGRAPACRSRQGA